MARLQIQNVMGEPLWKLRPHISSFLATTTANLIHVGCLLALKPESPGSTADPTKLVSGTLELLFQFEYLDAW
jgi:hypothetical protein